MAKSDARFGYRAKMNRDSHDLGRKFLFSCTSGQLLPIWEDIATPGDSYYIQHDLDYLRTAPLLAPAMVDVKVHFETFFVPAQMIYQPIEQSLFSIKDLQSSLYNLLGLQNEVLPTLKWTDIVAFLIGAGGQVTSTHQDCFRLADLFGLNPLSLAADSRPTPAITPLNSYQPSFFPWQICTYHCIWEYFYRLDDKTQFNQELFNLDKFYASPSNFLPSAGDPSVPFNLDFVSIHQRAWDFDYFTSLYRSPIVSNANLQSVLPSADYSFLVDGNTLPISEDGTDRSSTNSLITAFTHNHGTGGYSLKSGREASSTAAIRQLFANEKLAMITGRARKTYDSQVLAHFGVKVPHDVKHDIYLIGADTYDLSVGEVTSLSATSDATLGDLAGKGWSMGHGKKHKFIAPCHGYVMTIFSIEPKRRYNAGFDRINAISTVFDLPVPEFDRLGNVPMFRYECGYQITGSSTYADIIGWKERYYQNKRKYDRSTVGFMLASTNRGVNEFSAYSMTYAPYTTGQVLFNSLTPRPNNEDLFYIDKFAMDSLVAAPYAAGWFDGNAVGTEENWNLTPWLVYQRDPFIVDSNVKVTKVSWMSKDGEPVYNY